MFEILERKDYLHKFIIETIHGTMEDLEKYTLNFWIVA